MKNNLIIGIFFFVAIQPQSGRLLTSREGPLTRSCIRMYQSSRSRVQRETPDQTNEGKEEVNSLLCH